jgi:hypothetical protein
VTEQLIRPEDVSAADAKAILDFLNSAQTAQQIADRIELPNEPDVGPRLAAAILARRTQLEGFTNIGQLLEVKGIGPVRFTRIVESLVGTVEPVDQKAFDALAAQVAALQSRLDALKLQAGGTAGPRVELRAVEAQRYLGQPTTLIATVTGPDGLRAIGVPVTLTASWGRLRGSDGFSVQEGGSVTLRTAGDGTVRATLVPPTSEDLEASQQSAIEAMLARLDPAAPTPREAADELTALVGAYRFDANDDLRAGVDIYFRDFHQHLVDRVNFRDELDSWPTFDSAVTAYVQADSTVQATAVLVVRCRDWLGAWLQTHVDSAGAQTLLGGELELATNLDAPADMLSRIHQRVGEFVSLQTGVVGQVVAQKVADAKLTGFLQNGGLDRLPEEHKQALFPAVDTSSNTVATLGVQALGAIEQTRTDLRQNVDAQIQAAVPQAIEQSPAITSLQTAVAAKVDQTTFDQQIATKVDITTLNQKLSAADDFSAFKTSLLPVLIIRPIERFTP